MMKTVAYRKLLKFFVLFFFPTYKYIIYVDKTIFHATKKFSVYLIKTHKA